VNPAAHVHWKLPLVFLQFSLAPHGAGLAAHSSTSLQVVPSPSKPGLHSHIFPALHVAFGEHAAQGSIEPVVVEPPALLAVLLTEVAPPLAEDALLADAPPAPSVNVPRTLVQAKLLTPRPAIARVVKKEV
jgi:hypothetical protein